ncbi:hypothetical protein SETIT_9G067500v2 [Setaria italica]|uniref:Uncharacterized protein n=1 Tax=Setaria italica TaxID=4555 RepID=A0A368SDT1_SETIT|nr:hypothetical protein SETIT_9G067500v2 [Setaria italica]
MITHALHVHMYIYICTLQRRYHDEIRHAHITPRVHDVVVIDHPRAPVCAHVGADGDAAQEMTARARPHRPGAADSIHDTRAAHLRPRGHAGHRHCWQLRHLGHAGHLRHLGNTGHFRDRHLRHAGHFRHLGNAGHFRDRHLRHAGHFRHLGNAGHFRDWHLRHAGHFRHRKRRQAWQLGHRQVGEEAGRVARVGAAAEEHGGHDERNG